MGFGLEPCRLWVPRLAEPRDRELALGDRPGAADYPCTKNEIRAASDGRTPVVATSRDPTGHPRARSLTPERRRGRARLGLSLESAARCVTFVRPAGAGSTLPPDDVVGCRLRVLKSTNSGNAMRTELSTRSGCCSRTVRPRSVSRRNPRRGRVSNPACTRCVAAQCARLLKTGCPLGSWPQRRRP